MALPTRTISLTRAISRAQFYAVHLEPGTIASVEDLAICLHSIWTAAKAQKNVPPVGILTSDNRKTWALARKQLLKGNIDIDPSRRNLIRIDFFYM